jgi:hypothetical protein
MKMKLDKERGEKKRRDLDKLEEVSAARAQASSSMKSPINLVSPLEDVYDETVTIFKFTLGHRCEICASGLSSASCGSHNNSYSR